MSSSLSTAATNRKRELLLWSEQEAAAFGRVPQLSKHSVHELPLFTDDVLLEILERHPRKRLRVFVSGSNPENRTGESQPVDTEGASASDILNAVRVGRIWVNLQRVDLSDKRFRDLGDRLYTEMQQKCPHFKPEEWKPFLFISSPNAMVYLHVDNQPNILWHMRGTKRVWVYLPQDERILSEERLEEICTGGEDDVVYRPEFERYASVFDLGPGDVLSWPALSPHRVLNGPDLNVSLSTFHITRETYNLTLDYRANYYFKRRLPLLARVGKSNRSMKSLRRYAFRVCYRLGWAQPIPEKAFYASFRIDRSAPLGMKPIASGSVLTQHSSLKMVSGAGKGERGK